MRYAALVGACVVALAGVLSGQGSHPCDVAPVGPWVLTKGKPPVFGWCQAGDVDGFLVSVNNGPVYDTGALAPVDVGGVYGAFYEYAWPGSGFGKDNYTLAVRAYRVDAGERLEGPAGTLLFSRR